MAQITWQLFTSAAIRLGESYFRNQFTTPQNYKLLLCNGVLSTSSSLIDVLTTELTQANGYNRKSVVFSPYSLAGNSLTWTSIPVEFIASGQSWQFTHAVLISDGHANSNKIVESMSSATNQITVTGHGLSLNDKVMFTVSASEGVDLARIYYAIPVDANNFKISTSANGSEVDITTNNSGGGFLHYANGDSQLIVTYPDTQNCYAGQTRSISVIWGIG